MKMTFHAVFLLGFTAFYAASAFADPETISTEYEAPRRHRNSRITAVEFRLGGSLGSGNYSDNTLVPLLPMKSGLDGSSNLGFTGSVGIQLPLSGNVYFQPELSFAQKGFTNDIDPESTRSLRFGYVEAPLLFKLKANTEKLRPYGLLGAAPGFLLASGYTATVSGAESSGQFPTVTFNRFSVAAIGGLGLEIPMNDRYGFLIEGRYSRGLMNVMNRNAGNDAKMYFHSIQVLAGLGVNL